MADFSWKRSAAIGMSGAIVAALTVAIAGLPHVVDVRRDAFERLGIIIGAFFLSASAELVVFFRSARSIIGAVFGTFFVAVVLTPVTKIIVETLGFEYTRSNPQPATLVNACVFVVLHIATLGATRFMTRAIKGVRPLW